MESFRVDVPDEVLNDLRRRLKLTRWATDFANEGWEYGTNTAYLKELVAYWIEGYDWRKQELAINAYPQFRTEIDGVPIHFIHVLGKGPHPKPLILSRGWPWTFWEYRKVIGALSDPGAHGCDPADAFDVGAVFAGLRILHTAAQDRRQLLAFRCCRRRYAAPRATGSIVTTDIRDFFRARS